MKTSELINEIAAALAKAQGEMKNPLKDSDNPFFKSKYADLAANIDAARPALAKHAIACVQTPYSVDGAIGVITRLVHASGQWIESDTLSAMPKDSGPQAVGTCVTYLRRYQYAPMVGLAAEDDDGNASSVAAHKPEPVQRRPPGTISRKETQPDHAKADAALEEAGKEVFGGEPSKFAIGCEAIKKLDTRAKCREFGERIMELQRHGELTVAEAEDLDLRRIARMNELTDAEKPPTKPTIDAEWWKEYADLLAQAVDLDAVARVRDYHSGQVVTPTDLLRVTEMADGRFAALAAKPKGKAKQAALIN